MAVAAVLVVGCGPSDEEAPDPWAAEIERVRQASDDPTVQDVLRDGRIDDAEMTQVGQEAVACLAARGFEGQLDGSTNLGVRHPPGASEDDVYAAYEACAGGAFEVLSRLSDDMKYNPENAPRAELELACFKRFHLVGQDMTVDEFKAIDITDPPWDPVSGDAGGCWSDPIGYQGGAPPMERPPEDITFTGPPASGG